jgi:hypothetical protein
MLAPQTTDVRPQLLAGISPDAGMALPDGWGWRKTAREGRLDENHLQQRTTLQADLGGAEFPASPLGKSPLSKDEFLRQSPIFSPLFSGVCGWHYGRTIPIMNNHSRMIRKGGGHFE